MCGLTFIHSADANEADLRACSAIALERLIHRGPDGHGLFSGNGWAMGHRRLSIIDLAGSPQPMWDPSRRYCLSYNGEIYNYRELRLALETDWQFTTQGDTEVLLAGLLLKGPSFLERMNGMWAFALWDTTAQQLFLARDPMGKKPLYFDVSSAGIACASELPALRSLSARPWHEDDDSTADYLRYGYYLPSYTAYREVREVLPGHFVNWRVSEAQVNQTPYWQLPLGRFTGTRSDAAECLRHTLTEAVHLRLVADVEVGAFLSGGVDSSLICAIVREARHQSLRSFTIGFDDLSYDERSYAQRAAGYLGTDHHAEKMKAFSPAELDRLLLGHVGAPFQDPSLLPTAIVSQVAAREVKVALSGDGGDELFCGYQRYQARAILRWYTRLPHALRKNSQKLLRAIPEPGLHHSRSLIKKAHLFCDIAERAEERLPYVAPEIMPRELRLQLSPDLANRGHQPPDLPESTRPDDITHMMVRDSLIYLPQDILAKVDRASMAASLEVRSPFLDTSVVKLALSLPRVWHQRNFAGKHMLREAFSDLLPSWVWRRRKQGFSVPLQSWFCGPLGERLRSTFSEDQGPIKGSKVLALLDENQQGRRDRGQVLWLLHAYALWRTSRS